MRFMSIAAFSNATEITDFPSFYKTRLASGRSTEGTAGISLLGYMIAPNDPAERDEVVKMIRDWLDHGENGPLPPRLVTRHQHWARVTDILQLHYAIAKGGHQEKRGGASLGKAIHVVANKATSKGTGAARLWAIWKAHKDVAHLVTAAVMIAADIKELHKRSPLDVTLQHMLPLRVVLLMPELVIAVAMTIERYGLDYRRDGEPDPLFDPETLWRIPEDISVKQLPLPERKLAPEELAILNDRRAGNRGKRHRPETEAKTEAKTEIRIETTPIL